MEYSSEKKVVLITGGAGGIGYELTWRFAANGHQVLVIDRDEVAIKRVKEVFKDAGYDVHFFTLDLTHHYDLNRVVNNIEIFSNGKIDILINNAGIGHHGSLESTDKSKMHQMMHVNFFAAVNLTSLMLGLLKKTPGSQIVNICSGQVFFKLPTWGAYTCTKSALSAYSETLHFELKQYGIDVTTVYPFMVDTPFYKDVKGKSWGSKLSMKLLPYYSMSADKTAYIIYEAIKKRKKVEMVSLFNYLGKFMNTSSTINSAVGRISNLFLNSKI